MLPLPLERWSCVMRVKPGVLSGCTIPMRSVAFFSVTRHRPGHQLIARIKSFTGYMELLVKDGVFYSAVQQAKQLLNHRRVLAVMGNRLTI